MSQPRAATEATTDALQELRSALRQFALDRDWAQFHSSKNLAIALSVEAAEVLEHFQWSSAEEEATFTAEKRAQIRLELADVLLYLVRLADRLNIDLASAARDKIALNAQKYPVERAKGSAKKYTEL
jgi:dCTP diphosphatase